MATATPAILGQKYPLAGVNSALFTVAATYQAQFTVFVCNQSTVIDYFNIALVPSGSTETTASYLSYQTPIAGNTVFAVSGISLNSGDAVYVTSTNGTSSFTATGTSIGP